MLRAKNPHRAKRTAERWCRKDPRRARDGARGLTRIERRDRQQEAQQQRVQRTAARNAHIKQLLRVLEKFAADQTAGARTGGCSVSMRTLAIEMRSTRGVVTRTIRAASHAGLVMVIQRGASEPAWFVIKAAAET